MWPMGRRRCNIALNLKEKKKPFLFLDLLRAVTNKTVQSIAKTLFKLKSKNYFWTVSKYIQRTSARILSPIGKPNMMLTALQALARLQDGNRRFVANNQDRSVLTDQARRHELIAGQEPFAIILGCSDSRVPAELIFDQGLGDLFVIRVAGNIVAPSQIGSVEFAVERFGTRLVVVLGHSMCGAVQATLEELERPSESRSPNLRAIVDRISPAVETLLETNLRENTDALMHHAVRANIRASVAQLSHASRILEQLIHTDGLHVVGAEYSLETGVVDFFDGMP
jgi:carbonic anhydrase